MFLTFVALSLLLILVLPMVVGVVAGDSIAGEAGYGTLRYLLAVPAGRTRLLAVKYATIVVWAVAATFVVSVVALVAGVALFGAGPVTLLSGTTVSLADGLVHVLWVTLYVCAAMAAFGAIALAISTFTEHSIGAIAAALMIVVASEVVDNIPQFAPVAPYLPTHWWLSFDSLLRTPIDTTTLVARPAELRGLRGRVPLDRLGALHLRGRHKLTPRSRLRGVPEIGCPSDHIRALKTSSLDAPAGTGHQVKSSSQNSMMPRPARASASWARSSTRRILPEMVLGRSPNSTRRIRL